MANLEKELLRESSKNRTPSLTQDAVVKEATKLLANNAAEDHAILKGLGLHYNIQEAEKIRAKAMDLEKMEEKYGHLFTEDEVKAIACKYGLKFLPTSRYRGPVDAVLVQKIKEFSKETGVEINHATLEYHFKMLAPAKLFTLEDRVIKEGIRARLLNSFRDPIVFYNIPGTSNYRMIHKWGGDISIWRRITSWKHSSEEAYWMTWFFSILLPPVAIVAATTGTYWGLLATVPALIVACVRTFSESDEYEPWNETWNIPLKPKF